MLDPAPRLRRPGLFVTATDTEVGKTVAACAIAANLRHAGMRVGVCKPLASGCRRDREGLVSEDAEALAHFADCRQPLDVVHPIRYRAPLAPAVAAEMTGQPPDWAALTRALERLDADCDAMVIEGIGGLMVPIDPAEPRRTVLDLVIALGYPVVVVARAGLGTLNHTAMTVQLLKHAGCRVAGLIINGYVPDPGKAEGDTPAPGSDQATTGEASQDAPYDESMSTNREWLRKMSRVPILATIPRCRPEQVAPQRGLLPDAILDAVGATYWAEVIGRNVE